MALALASGPEGLEGPGLGLGLCGNFFWKYNKLIIVIKIN